MNKTNMELIGAINDVPSSYKLKGYQTWFAMIKRVHQDLYQLSEPQYLDTTIEPCWYRLSTYLAWYELHNPDSKLAIDKDLIGMNTYGPDTCVAISQNLNNALQVKGNNNGLPTGIRLTPTNSYTARIRKYYEVTSKTFKTKEEASTYYNAEKSDYLRLLAKQELNPDIPKLVENFIQRNLI